MKKINYLRLVLIIQVMTFLLTEVSFGQTNSTTTSSQSSSIQSSDDGSLNSIIPENSVTAAPVITRSASICTAPIGVTVSEVNPTNAKFSWTSNANILYYNFRYRKTGTTTWITDSTSSNTKIVNGLIPITNYEVQVQTRCTAGLLSKFGSKVLFTTTYTSSCGSTSGLSATSISTSGATLHWATVSGAIGYSLQYKLNSATAWTTVSITTNSKALTGLTSGSTYKFQVATICSSTMSAYSTASTFATTASTVNCGIPDVALFGTRNKTSSSATVYWTRISGALSYNVQYRLNGSSAAWTTVSTSTESASLTGLNSSTQYVFQVQTVCSGGASSFSSSGIFTTTAFACSVPAVADFTSNAITGSSATVGWNSVSNSIGYNVQYRVRGTGAAWNAVTSTSNSAVLSGLTSSTLYEFQVQTACNGGNSAFSASGIFTTTNSVACGLPDVTMFTATNRTSSSATVGWNAVSSASSYNVQYRVKNSGSAWSTVSATTVSANLSGLTASTQYEFQVQTICSAGTGSFSASGIFSTNSSSTACGIPTGINVSGISISAATIDWNTISGATSYLVQYRKSGTSSWSNATSSNTSESVSGLLSGTAYEVQVQAICSNGPSSFSESVVFTTLTSGSASLPVPDHIVIVMFENHAFQEIIGNSAAPHINAFSNEANTTLFTESYGIEHPSQPNYLDFFSGSNQGVTNNVKPAAKFNTMNLAAALLQGGFTYKSYVDGLPSVGYDGDVSGTYMRKHNPVSNWVGTGTNQVPAALNIPFTSFPTDFSTLPTVCFVTPDMNNSMHDGSGNSAITTGDNWFYSKIYPYAQWAKTHNSLLIFTFDEDNSASGNRITTIFAGGMVTQGQNSTGINHYNVLRTIEDMYGISHSGNAANASPIHDCWTTGFRMAHSDAPDVASEFSFDLFPNPAVEDVNVSYTLEDRSNVSIRLIDAVGKTVVDQPTSVQESGKHEVSFSIAGYTLSKGIYFVELMVNEKRMVKRVMVN